ncbi:hypothetical protein CDV55_100510 [Aspergillus turcosus]|uniref:Uncharacterized protein n=1 Tax=Aspergillus turcosus TaxID=1245748 RepID=A0A397GTQ0_9EURO|nr:hypothetical protein CDV55_100510 [Aspergillus turcosus]RLL96122.1 hypothetical protein CFD26_106357 [Aspergillus turcosus]
MIMGGLPRGELGGDRRVDYVAERLRLAESIGATPINCRDADRVDQIHALQQNGVARSVDAAGYEQVHLADFFFREFQWAAGPSEPIDLAPQLVQRRGGQDLRENVLSMQLHMWVITAGLGYHDDADIPLLFLSTFSSTFKVFQFSSATMSISAIPYRAYLRQKEAEFFSLIDQGTISPWLFPHDFLVLVIPILVLLIPNKGQSWVTGIRYTAVGLVCSLGIRNLLHTRCLLGGGTVIGFYYVFIIIWSALFLLLKDVEKECFRIERSSKGTLYWQGYPDSICHRLSWLLDMFGSLRGAGWNWRIPGLPPIPNISSKDQQTPTDGKQLAEDAPSSNLLRISFLRTARYYLLMDILKVLTMLDPYFW